MTGCPTDNELVEYAEGLLTGDALASVALHVDACERCRGVLAGLARTSSPRPSGSAIGAPERELVPGKLLRDQLRMEAPDREKVATATIAIVAAVGFVALPFAPYGPAFVRSAMIADAVVLVYALGVHVAIRRGWFHPAMPFVDSLVELSIVFAMQLIVVTTAGVEAAMRSPARIMWGVTIVFSAIRFDPRICILLGIAGAIEHHVVSTFGGVPSGGRTIGEVMFFAFAGIAGAMIARYLVARAEHALRAMRAQDMFGKYILHERLGRGGMGEVLRGTYCPEGGFEKTVAVKRMRADVSRNAELVGALRQEAKLCSTLVHPNLVQVLDCGTFQGAFVLVMEHVDGLSLSALVRRARAPLDLAGVTYVAAELAAALAYVHDKVSDSGAPLGLVHRDVNPPNVLVSKNGEVKLADFGVARAETSQMPTEFAGKLAYAAPEQLVLEPVDARADLYGLGLTIHEMLTREPRREPASEPLRPSASRPDVPGELDALVIALTEPDRERRPSTAAEVRERLLAMRGAHAPYPHGVRALARAVADASSP